MNIVSMKTLILFVFILHLVNGSYVLDYGYPATINISKNVIGKKYELYRNFSSSIVNDSDINYRQNKNYTIINFNRVNYEVEGTYELRCKYDPNVTKLVIIVISTRNFISYLKNEDGHVYGTRWIYDIHRDASNVTWMENNKTFSLLGLNAYNHSAYSVLHYDNGYNKSFIRHELVIIPGGIYVNGIVKYEFTFENDNITFGPYVDRSFTRIVIIKAKLEYGLLLRCPGNNDVWYYNRFFESEWRRYSTNDLLNITSIGVNDNGYYGCGYSKHITVYLLNVTIYDTEVINADVNDGSIRRLYVLDGLSIVKIVLVVLLLVIIIVAGGIAGTKIF